MAKSGNHGVVIPRNREYLHRLYWIDGQTLPQIGKLFGVTHKSVERVFRDLDIPRRGKGVPPTQGMCVDCGIVKIKKIPHKLTKNGTGTRCHECLLKYKREWLRKELKVNSALRESRKQFLKRYYEVGPLNPKGERQWIAKSKALLRTVRKLSQGRISHERLQFLNEAFVPGPTSRT